MKEQYQVNLVEVPYDQKFILKQLLELYEYDFSEFNNNDVNEYGMYGYKYLDHYWTEDSRHPFFIKANGQLAGFVLINGFCYLYENVQAHAIAEFFVMRKYRRYGIGKTAATQVFDQFKGNWEVLQHGNNDASKLFWKNVIHTYTSGSYEIKDVTTEHWIGQGMVFNNAFTYR